jgi:hypothetical protein
MQKVGIWRIAVGVQHGQKVSETPTQQTKGAGRQITVQGQPRQECKPLSEKQPKVKKADGVPQVAEHLPSKCKDLSSNLITIKKVTDITSEAAIYYAIPTVTRHT